MSNDENNAVTSEENNQSNMTVDAFGNYVNVESTQNNAGDKKGSDKKILIIIAGVVAVLAVVIILLNSSGSGGARGVAEKYASSFRKMNAEAIVNLLPKEVIDKAKEKDEDLKESLQEVFDSAKEQEVTFVSVTVEDEEKNLTKEEIKDADYMLEIYGIDVNDVSEAIVFSVKMTVKNKDGETDEEDAKITIIKIKGDWKLFPVDIS